MNLDQLKAVKTIVVHDNCSDGLMSALLLQDAYRKVGLSPELKFIQYGTEPYKALTPGPNMMFCDFSPDIKTVKQEDGSYKIDEAARARLQGWVDAGTLILDHHAGAKPVVEAFGANGVFGDEKTMPGVCGAWLAFREVWVPFMGSHLSTVDPMKAIPPNDYQDEGEFASNFAALVGIRDTWQNKHARWREACVLNEALHFYPQGDWLAKANPFQTSNWGWWDERVKLGDILWTKHEKGIQKCIQKSWRFTSAKGTRVIVFEGVRSSSDVAEAMGSDVDLIIGFDYEAEAPKTGGDKVRKIILSTRSHTNFNCLDFAKAHGGGGHTKAAGCNVEFGDPQDANPLSRYAYNLNPYALAEALVNQHEGKQQRT